MKYILLIAISGLYGCASNKYSCDNLYEPNSVTLHLDGSETEVTPLLLSERGIMLGPGDTLFIEGTDVGSESALDGDKKFCKREGYIDSNQNAYFFSYKNSVIYVRYQNGAIFGIDASQIN